MPLAGWLAGLLAAGWLRRPQPRGMRRGAASKQASSAGGEAEAQAHTEEQPAVVVDRPTQYKTTYLMMSEAHRAAAWFVVQCCYYCC